MANPLKLTPEQQAQLKELQYLEGVKAVRNYRQRGRLFVGAAPTSECSHERKELFREWDKIVAHYGAKKPDNLLRYLRDAYERPETRKDCREMKFLVRVEELREFEAAEWERLKDKGGKRAGQWVSQSKKRRG